MMCSAHYMYSMSVCVCLISISEFRNKNLESLNTSGVKAEEFVLIQHIIGLPVHHGIELDQSKIRHFARDLMTMSEKACFSCFQCFAAAERNFGSSSERI